MTAPFVVLFSGREGSSYLVEALSSHSEVEAVGEKFKRQGAKKELRKKSSKQLDKMREFLTRSSEADHRAVGFKIKHRDIIDPDGLRALLQDLPARVIHLSRRNIIKQVVSHFNAIRLNERTGKWNLYGEEPRAGSLEVAPDQFDLCLGRFEKRRRALLQYVWTLELPTLSVQYEDLLLDHDETLRMVFAFLGVGCERVQGVARKNTSDDLRQVLKNLDELKERYRGTRYGPMFEQILVPSLADPPGR